MSYTTSKTNLIKDCSLLFDSEIFNYVDFLNSLSSSVLKSAYRKKALETHPDRSLALGKCKDKMDNRFKDVISAYERLDSFIQAEEKIILKNEVGEIKKAEQPSDAHNTNRKILQVFPIRKIPTKTTALKKSRVMFQDVYTKEIYQDVNY